MEIGRSKELTVLTPSEVEWLRKDLRQNAKVGPKMLAEGAGRKVRCCGGDDGACEKHVTHYAATAFENGSWRGYCLEHWKSGGDPQKIFGLNDEPGPAAETRAR